MASHRRSRTRDRSGNASFPGEFESIDPSTFFGDPAAPAPDRKTLQLCKQVARTLGVVLAGEIHDDALRGVLVDDATPAPDASHLLVTVIPSAEGTSPDAVLAALRHAKPFLRAAVASGIHRKRAPELSFCVAAPPEVQP